MSPSDPIEWLLCLAVAIAGAALLSPIVINASMIAAGPRKALRVRTAHKLATWAFNAVAALCLARLAAGWPDAPFVWAMFAAVAAAVACLTASRLQEGAARERLRLLDSVFIAIAAACFLLSGIDLGSMLAWGAVAVIAASFLELLAYWMRARNGRGPRLLRQSDLPGRPNT